MSSNSIKKGTRVRRVALEPEAPSGGPGAGVTLYDGSGNLITSTSENGDQSLDVHVSNDTIEQSTDATFNDKSIVAGAVDASGNVQGMEYGVTTTLIDEAASATYFGDAQPGTATSAASWRILRLTTSGTVKTFDYADGNANFDNVWTDRASLSYS